MRHGIFLPPFHMPQQNATLALQRDFELLRVMDDLGFDEAWIGEHHSGGWETISSPEIFIAGAVERTRRLQFGTGVISLPYHNPFNVASRIVQLDHQTRGRVMFGFGPGLLASDAHMLGVEPEQTRQRMAQALDVIVRLLRGEVVTEETDWYKLQDARLHLLPFTRPYPELAVASVITPSGAQIAGEYDTAMLCLAAGDQDGFPVLDRNWAIAEKVAAEHGRTMDRSRVRIVLGVHLAETVQDGKQEPPQLLLVQFPLALQDGAQGLALLVVHHDVGGLVHLEVVQHPHQVGMAEARQGPRFVEETLETPSKAFFLAPGLGMDGLSRPYRKLVREELLDRHLPPQTRVPGQVGDPETADPEDLNKTMALQLVSGWKRLFVFGISHEGVKTRAGPAPGVDP